ncbi:hypothetical protein EDC96DRAFT_510518 [Choanephora cucurbitarum]|nr:hypothetical protein EDC96DRAFT_510518 [Choanephora cucurbitarum]
MEKLPQELSCYVFSLLGHLDCLQCSLVCKRWKYILDRTGVLLETLQCQSDRQLETAMRYFSTHKELLRRVKRISINKAGHLPQQLIVDQALLFTETQHIELFFQPTGIFSHTPGSRKYATRSERNTASIEFLSPQLEDMLREHSYWTQLKTISETSPKMYTSSILFASTTPFNNLHSIWLNFALIHPSLVSFATQRLVIALINAPQLQQIFLMFVYISRPELDTLHKCCTKLESLTLYKSTLDIFLEESGESLGVLPEGHRQISAPSMTKVSFIDVKVSHSLSLFSYISYKYPNLTDLTCLEQQLYTVRSNIIQTNNPSALERLASSCPQLMHLKTNIYPFTLDAYKAFDLHCKQFQLKEFVLCSDDDESISSFDVIANSHFRHTVKHISIETVTHKWTDISRRLSQFTYLTHINIEDTNVEESHDDQEQTAFRVPLDLVLSEHQHLEKLCIKDCFVYRTSRTECFSSLVRKLSLLNVTLDADKDNSCQSLMDLISESCTQLHHLHIHGDTYSSDHILALDLRNHSQLATLDIYLWSFDRIYLQVEGEPERWLEVQRAGDEYDTERIETKRHKDSHRPGKSNFFDLKLAHAIPKFYQDEFEARLYEESYKMYY